MILTAQQESPSWHVLGAMYSSIILHELTKTQFKFQLETLSPLDLQI